MGGETILGIIIMSASCLICAASFFGVGVWASKRKDPMNFWSGTRVDPKTISDIPAYNRENARMWKAFSVPFWLMIVLEILSAWFPWLVWVAIALLALSCTVGLAWLVWKYGKIKRKYQTVP